MRCGFCQGQGGCLQSLASGQWWWRAAGPAMFQAEGGTRSEGHQDGRGQGPSLVALPVKLLPPKDRRIEAVDKGRAQRLIAVSAGDSRCTLKISTKTLTWGFQRKWNRGKRQFVKFWDRDGGRWWPWAAVDIALQPPGRRPPCACDLLASRSTLGASAVPVFGVSRLPTTCFVLTTGPEQHTCPGSSVLVTGGVSQSPGALCWALRFCLFIRLLVKYTSK